MRHFFFLVCILLFQLSFFCWADGEKKNFTLTIDEIVDRALQVSLNVDNAKVDKKIQTMQLAKTMLQLSPKVSAAWAYNHFDSAIPFLNEQGVQEVDRDGQLQFIRPLNTSTGSITIIQPLTGFMAGLAGALVDGIRQTKSRLVIENVKIDVSFFAAITYRQVQQAESIYLIAEDRVVLAEKQRKEAEVSFRVGRLSKSDVLRLDVLVSQAKVETARARAIFENTQAQFLDILEYQSNSVFRFEKISDGKHIEINISVPTLDEARADAYVGRFDLKMARLSQKELEGSSLLPLLSILPNVNAFMKVEHNFLPAGFFSMPSTKTMGLTLDWSLWDGGDRFLSRRILQLQSYKAKSLVAGVERGLSLEILRTRSDLLAAQDVLSLQKSMLLQSEEAYRGVSERFRLGALSVTELLQAENTLNTTRVDLAKAVIDLDIKNMLLQKAMGKTRPVSVL
jgi:outer membrane protein TolC